MYHQCKFDFILLCSCANSVFRYIPEKTTNIPAVMFVVQHTGLEDGVILDCFIRMCGDKFTSYIAIILEQTRDSNTKQ